MPAPAMGPRTSVVRGPVAVPVVRVMRAVRGTAQLSLRPRLPGRAATHARTVSAYQ